MTTKQIIRFYSTRGDYGCFSNFSRHPVKIGKTTYQTSEHYFQSQKYVGTPIETKIRDCKTPGEAARMGRDRKHPVPLRQDWENVKDNVMREVVLAKFSQHADLREILLSTGDAELVEDTTTDYYWGCGTDGSGKNMLGKILMETRAILQKTAKRYCQVCGIEEVPSHLDYGCLQLNGHVWDYKPKIMD
jgi:ribA/ribD-fused uncharacterized protein